jgi:5-methyltetrahydropteroyltriglutamate--homocysteine methyltransferase
VISIASLGMPRSNNNYSWAKVLKSFFAEEISFEKLESIGNIIKSENIAIQSASKVDIIPSNDFFYFDNVLDAMLLTGNIPKRFFWEGGIVPVEIKLAMILGQQKNKFNVSSLDSLHFFKTPYRYFVPEFDKNLDFYYSDNKVISEYLILKKKNIKTRPVILGAATFIALGKVADFEPVISKLLPIYEELFFNLKRINVTNIQIDEHIFAQDISVKNKEHISEFYKSLTKKYSEVKIDLVASYGNIKNNLDIIKSCPFNSIHFDVKYNYQNLEEIASSLPDKKISLGIVDSAGVLVNDIEKSVETIRKISDCNKIQKSS